MAKTDFQSIDAYFAAAPPEAVPALTALRAALNEALPGAVEGISYQIPCLKIGGKAVFYFAGYKKHVAVYPLSAGLLATFGDEVRPLLSGKATLQMPLNAPLPLELVTRLARARAAEIAAKPSPRARSAAGR